MTSFIFLPQINFDLQRFPNRFILNIVTVGSTNVNKPIKIIQIDTCTKDIQIKTILKAMDTIICLWLYHLHSEVIVKLKPDIKTVQHGLRATPVSNKAGSLSFTHLVSLVG